ncbi:MAG TPA: hypothetical protein VG406_02760 [Isosphaeraceae bacterium]|jgi:hypothetical protein|nr:hypothetical protein [Isosphaeraceae bacterium]
MSAGFEAEVRALMRQAAMLPNGPSQVALYEEAVRLADAHGDVPLAFDARDELITASTFNGYLDRALVAFSWCLGHCDREPSRFNDARLLWKYKWVANGLKSFPQFTLEQIEATIDDMARRYRKHGLSPRPVHTIRKNLAIHVGDRGKAREFMKLAQDAPRDSMSDCLACERNGAVHDMIFLGRDAEALDRAAPLLAGTMRCKRVPAGTLSKVLEPMLRLGRVAEAMACHHRGYRLIAQERDYLDDAAQHLGFLALTGNLAKGAKLVERHTPWMLEPSVSQDNRLDFALAARLFFERLRAAGRKRIKLRLPENFAALRPDATYDPAELEAWFLDDARALAARFDARNGTNRSAERIAENLDLARLATSYPLRAPKPKADEDDGPNTGSGIISTSDIE